MRHDLPVFVDPVAVDLFCSGQQVPLNRLERREAVARFTAEGRSQRWIADRFGITCRSVCRMRRRVREGVYA